MHMTLHQQKRMDPQRYSLGINYFDLDFFTYMGGVSVAKAMVNTEVSALSTLLEQRVVAMKQHRVFGLVRTLADLRTFMVWHVFAVWDFMSLVKRLQIEYTAVRLPWCPPKYPQAARFINEIILGEESDIMLDSQHSSHFGLYLAGMEEIGAPTNMIRQFVELVDGNMSIKDALHLSAVPPSVQEFVELTIDLSLNGSTEEVLGSFLYGRENVIPEMFQNLLNCWKLDVGEAPVFVFYLKRHINLDTDSRGYAASQLMQEVLKDNERAWIRMLSSAVAAVEQRIRLWDALAKTLDNEDNNGVEPIKKLHDQFLVY
jgi:hypothetical protein